MTEDKQNYPPPFGPNEIALKKLQASIEGTYPEGKMTEDDEGALTIAVGRQADKIVLAFPKEVTWIGMPVENARNFAQAILDKAEEVDGIICRIRRFREER